MIWVTKDQSYLINMLLPAKLGADNTTRWITLFNVNHQLEVSHGRSSDP